MRNSLSLTAYFDCHTTIPTGASRDDLKCGYGAPVPHADMLGSSRNVLIRTEKLRDGQMKIFFRGLNSPLCTLSIVFWKSNLNTFLVICKTFHP